MRRRSFRGIPPRMVRPWCALELCLLLLFSVGCRSHKTPAANEETKSSPAETPTAPASSAPVFDLLAHLHSCEIWHRGLTIDLGTPASEPLRNFSVGPFDDVEDIERVGATFARISARQIDHTFWLAHDHEDDLFLSLRVHGAAATRFFAYIDGHPIGGGRLARDTTRVIELHTIRQTLARGRHTLKLRFVGRLRGPDDVYAEIDWLRLGVRDDLDATYAAPTLRDIASDYEIDGQPKRSLVLRAPSSVRCSIRPSKDAKLRVFLGYWGAGKGTAEIRIVRDDAEPVTVQQRKVVGGSGAQWMPLDIDLAPYANDVLAVEFRALATSGGGRIVFGEPVVRRDGPPPAHVPEADTVIVVVAAALDRRRVPPWGRIGPLAPLGELVRSGVAFSNYRVPTTVAAGTFATILTGARPRSHTVEDQAARLPALIRTMNATVKAAGGSTAMFTSVPTTAPAFGFNAGWDRYEFYSPVEDESATKPFQEAERWLQQGAQAAPDDKRLLVIHARGAHPPWDLTKEEVAALPPEEYGGALDARRGGITLGKIRARRPAWRRLSQEEWVRLHALQDATLAKQVLALGRVFEVLKQEGLWERAMVMFLGDVAVGDPPRVPYDPAGPLTEDRLLTPLLVRFPANELGGKEAQVPASSVDLAPTILRALGADVPEQMRGLDLFQLAAGFEPVAGRPLVATLGTRYATRVGPWLLRGRYGEVPTLCRLDVDPACVADLFDSRPVVGQALWRWTFGAERQAVLSRGTIEREPASIGADIANALIVWGDIQ